MAPTAWWEVWQGDRQRRHTLDQAQDQRLLAYLGSLLAGDAGEGEAAELRLYGLGEHVRRRWRALGGRIGAARVRFGAVQAVGAAPAQLVSAALLLGGVLVLGRALAHGRIQAGDFVALLGALATFTAATAAAAACVRRIRIRSNELADFARLAAAADGGAEASLPPAHAPAGGGAPKPAGGIFPRPLREGIRLEGVQFTYAGAGHPAICGLDLNLRAGESLALVGPNGSGKSTLVKLLLGLYAPEAGRILADGVDLALVDPDSRRAALAPVFQDHLHLPFTAADAIGFGSLGTFLRGDADRVRLRRAAQAAGAATFLASLPLGYDTPLGRSLDERGVEPSGGQWQSLAIARALYAEPEVLILDEPAAALDPQAEADLYAQFRGLAGGERTTLLVTHRLGAARLADRIAVLDGGRIVEEGSHDELVAAGGRYARMWSAQAGWYR